MNERDFKIKQQQLLAELVDICLELNWVIGIPKEATTEGIICGTMNYVEAACLKTYGKDNYEIVDQFSSEERLATSDNVDEFKIIELTEEQLKEFIETGDLPEDILLLDESDKGPIYH